ncbi:MAG: DUF5103 domain-containing protein [Bacteroidota bacterium]
MKTYTSLFFLFFFSSIQLLAQSDFRYIDNTYVDNIRSVRFGPEGFQERFPLLTLNESGQLLLSFDDVDAEVKNYVYTVIHCDRNWQPSGLAPLEYIDGFEEEDINFYEFSFMTTQTFTYYEFLFPNQNINVTKSGNYLLVVYEDEDDKIPVITRRFVVVDRSVSTDISIVRPATVSKIHSHQEIDFTVDYQRLGVMNPRLELRATVLQNSRWDNAIYDLEPKFVRRDQAIFDYQDKIIFEGSNEFRFIDLRSLTAPQSDITDIGLTLDEQGVVAEMAPIISRANQAHLTYPDLNGSYIIENFDRRDEVLNSDYVNLLITYKPIEPHLQDHVFLFGEISEWQIKEAYRMRYNPAISAYVGRFAFKQGYYNYLLATVPSDSSPKEVPVPDFSKTEGSHADTENEYLVLTYYHPFGTRYDQVVGAAIINSNLR